MDLQAHGSHPVNTHDTSRHPNSIRATQQRPIGLQPAPPAPPMPTYPPGPFCPGCGLTRYHWAGCDCTCRTRPRMFVDGVRIELAGEKCPTHPL